MGKKKNLVISIILVILLIVVVVSTTYAFLSAITNEEEVGAGSGMLDINYTKPNDLTDENSSLYPSSTRNGGLKATATASLKTGSEVAIFNMYITPTALTNLNIPALKWEAEGIRDGEVICSGNGNFSGATVNEPIKLFVNDINDNIDDCVLSTDETTFNIYVWLDSSLVQGSPAGATFGAKIGADSVQITGGF